MYVMIFIIYEEKWVCKKIIEQWKKYNSDKHTTDINKATKIWLFNHYLYKKVPKTELPVITTIHHLEERKLDKREFGEVEKLTTYFHSLSPHTTETLKKYTNKKIIEAPMPIDPKENTFISDKTGLRKKWGFGGEYLIGSFQRDTEKDGKPKLEKGPDIFLKLLDNYKNPVVILTGYNRQYMINELEKKKIKYLYKENATEEEMNELYNILDLYIVSARVEGGPRSIFECALTKTPIISTDVGIASKILSKKSIYDFEKLESFKRVEPDLVEAYKNAVLYLAPFYMIEFNLKVFSNKNL